MTNSSEPDLPIDELDDGAPPELAEARHQDRDIARLQAMALPDLLQLARGEGLELLPGLGRQEVVFEVLKHRFARAGIGWGEGVLEVLPDGFGFLRSGAHDFRAGPDDIYVSPSQIRRLNLKPGAFVAGPVRRPRRGEKFFALVHVELVNGATMEQLRGRMPFEDLVPVLPRQRLHVAGAHASATVRMIERLAPWGLGQRVLLHAPPGCGRLWLLRDLLRGIAERQPALHQHVCLIDERPEDVTELRRSLSAPHVEVLATTFDEPTTRHLLVAEMALLRCQRMVEAGRDVVLAFDSLTRLVRACNQELPPTGRFLCAGLDVGALQKARRLLGAARSLESGGSLTVLATLLADGESHLDEAIAEEFRGRGNAEVHFDRALVDQHVEPAVDAMRTATRREDCLLPPAEIARLRELRTALSHLPPAERAAHVLRT